MLYTTFIAFKKVSSYSRGKSSEHGKWQHFVKHEINKLKKKKTVPFLPRYIPQNADNFLYGWKLWGKNNSFTNILKSLCMLCSKAWPFSDELWRRKPLCGLLHLRFKYLLVNSLPNEHFFNSAFFFFHVFANSWKLHDVWSHFCKIK